MIRSITRPYIVPTAPRILSRPSPAAPRRRTLVAISTGGGSYLASVNADVEAHLRRAVEVKPPIPVYEPLHHFAVAAAAPPPLSPAILAPALTVAAYELVGGENRDKGAAVAAALRLLFTVSHTHEPFLELDGSESLTRDPYDPSIRLMTGDGMVPFAIDMLARAHDPDSENSGRILRVMIESTRAIGSRGVVEEQYREIVRRRSSSGHVAEIEDMSEKMDSGIYACSAACGAILGGGSEEEIGRLRSYGSKVGKVVGLLKSSGERSGAIVKEVEKLSDLAMKELRCFKAEKVEALCSLIDAYLSFNYVSDKVA